MHLGVTGISDAGYNVSRSGAFLVADLNNGGWEAAAT
jgi:hypothetical protein